MLTVLRHIDIGSQELELKRKNQTSESVADKTIQQMKKNKKYVDQHAIEAAARHRAIEMAEPVPSPFAPAMDIYLRPATIADTKEILALYNYCKYISYVSQSVGCI